MNININHSEKDTQYRGTLTNEELSQNSFGALELADADLAIINGSCGDDLCGGGLGIGLGLSLDLGFGLGCQGSYDPAFFGGSWSRFGGDEFYGIPTPCHCGCH